MNPTNQTPIHPSFCKPEELHGFEELDLWFQDEEATRAGAVMKWNTQSTGHPAKIVAFDGVERTVTLAFEFMPLVAIGDLVSVNFPSELGSDRLRNENPWPDMKCDQCGRLSPHCAPDEGDSGWWCVECMNTWEEENQQRWEDGAPL